MEIIDFYDCGHLAAVVLHVHVDAGLAFAESKPIEIDIVHSYAWPRSLVLTPTDFSESILD